MQKRIWLLLVEIDLYMRKWLEKFCIKTTSQGNYTTLFTPMEARKKSLMPIAVPEQMELTFEFKQYMFRLLIYWAIHPEARVDVTLMAWLPSKTATPYCILLLCFRIYKCIYIIPFLNGSSAWSDEKISLTAQSYLLLIHNSQAKRAHAAWNGGVGGSENQWEVIFTSG